MYQHKHWISTFELEPPKSPHELYINAALDAIGEEYGELLTELSQEISEALINCAAHAAQAALDAARVSNDWSSLVQANMSHQAPPTQCRHDHVFPPAWQSDVIDSPVKLYAAMAWTYFQRERPNAFCDCNGFTDAQTETAYRITDELLRFALTAAGVDDAWERTYSRTVTILKGDE